MSCVLSVLGAELSHRRAALVWHLRRRQLLRGALRQRSRRLQILRKCAQCARPDQICRERTVLIGSVILCCLAVARFELIKEEERRRLNSNSLLRGKQARPRALTWAIMQLAQAT